jgi:hypothetical protein
MSIAVTSFPGYGHLPNICSNEKGDDKESELQRFPIAFNTRIGGNPLWLPEEKS